MLTKREFAALAASCAVLTFSLLGRPRRAVPRPTVIKEASLKIEAVSIRVGKGSRRVYEITDYECPSCQASTPLVRDILRSQADFTWSVILYPLASHHVGYDLAVRAEVAASLGSFTQFHALAQNLKARSVLDVPESIMATKLEHRMAIAADKRLFAAGLRRIQARKKALQVQSVPTFIAFDNGRSLATNNPYEVAQFLGVSLKQRGKAYDEGCVSGSDCD